MSDQNTRPFAVFDIDGTLIRWQLYHAVVDALAKAGFVTDDDIQKLRAARMQWKRRSHQDSYHEYEETIVAIHDKAVQALSREDFMHAVEHAFEEYKDQTYTYTRDLIRSLKAQDYLLFAISASQIEIVDYLARHYGFDDWAASIYEHEGGRFTGNKDVMWRTKKPEQLKKLVEKHGATHQGSIGVGDSDSDIPMLETVERPIAFNPNKILFQHAQKQGWRIVVERKNMVYELEQANGKYTLLA